LANVTWFGVEARVFGLGFGLLADLGDTLAALTAALKETAAERSDARSSTGTQPTSLGLLHGPSAPWCAPTFVLGGLTEAVQCKSAGRHSD
jgi:hypothetical protein